MFLVVPSSGCFKFYQNRYELNMNLSIRNIDFLFDIFMKSAKQIVRLNNANYLCANIDSSILNPTVLVCF